MNIIRRDLLYLAAIAAQISDACNRLLTLTRGIGAHARMCGSSTFHQMSAYLNRGDWFQLLPSGYLHCDIDKEPMKAVS